MKKKSKSSKREKAAIAELRRQGLRRIEIWVPDVTSPAFVAEARRQSLAVAKSTHEKRDQEFIDSISEED